MKRRSLLLGGATIGATTLAGVAASGLFTASALARTRHIGYLTSNAASTLPTVQPFFDRLRDLGYVEGAGTLVHRQLSHGDATRLGAMAAELVASRVDVIVAVGGAAQYAATAATREVPIVLLVGPDPVEAKFVSSLARPGGNATGVLMPFNQVMAKKLEFLKELVPGIRRVAAVYRSDNTTVTSANYARRVAADLGLTVDTFGIATLADTDATLRRIEDGRFDGLITTSVLSAVEDDHARIPTFAATRGLPACYGDIELVRAGGLMHYTPRFDAMYREGADLVDKILRGANPADLPVETTRVFDLAINPNAAERIGISFPSSVLLQATEILR